MPCAPSNQKLYNLLMDTASDQSQKFSRYKSLDLQNKLYQIKALALARKYQKTPKAKILEVGCADGSFISLAAKNLDCIPYGLDITTSSIKIALKNGVQAKVHDLGSRLPFPDNTFRLVFALEIIEHLYDTDFFVSELKRVLAPKGFVILSTPNLVSLPNRLKMLFGGYPQYTEHNLEGAGHLRSYTLPVLKSQLLKNGFKPLVLTSPNLPCPNITLDSFPKVLRVLAMRLGDFLPSLGSHLLILASK